MLNEVTPLLAQGTDLWPVLVVILLLLIVLVLPRMARRKTAGTGRGSSPSNASSSARGREQMEDLVVKLHDFGREIQAKLDNKISVLDRLIEEADEKIRRLEGHGLTTGRPKRGESSKPDKPSSGTGDVAKIPLRPKTGKYKNVYDLADEGHDVVSIARQTGLQPGEIELLLELRKTRDKDEQ